MHLAHIKVQNFRCLKNFDLQLHKGLNILLGENDLGKTALIDAIRFILGTRDFERLPLSRDDFYIDENGRANNLKIQVKFEELSDEEAKLFLEWLGIKGKKPDGSLEYFLKLTMVANRKEINRITNKYEREITYTITAGPDDEGFPLVPEVRDLLRTTYLKPLRDAEQELAARKGSRLSQILLANKEIRNEEGSKDAGSIPMIIKEANTRVRNHPLLLGQEENLNENYLSNFKLGNDAIKASMNISDPTLKGILEHLELTLEGNVPDVSLKHGLGFNNLLFMAAEMLLLASENSPELPLMLIEEPEAHLHPQLQLRLIEFLQKRAFQQGSRPVQVIVTSHSPNLAAKVDLENVILMKSGLGFSLSSENTKLQQSDYKFLQRFLDVTKANLFFARGVLIVEGDAEQILIPCIARLIGYSFEEYGISIVNVGHIGLFRYARIFQRKDEIDIGIRVACITDLDIASDEARNYLNERRHTRKDFSEIEIEEEIRKKKGRASGGPVHTFVSPLWTLEHDLCAYNLDIAALVHEAVQLTISSKRNPDGLSEDEQKKIKQGTKDCIQAWLDEGRSGAEIAAEIYYPLYSKTASKPETAQFLAKLLEDKYPDPDTNKFKDYFPNYLVEAIRYTAINKLGE